MKKNAKNIILMVGKDAHLNGLFFVVLCCKFVLDRRKIKVKKIIKIPLFYIVLF